MHIIITGITLNSILSIPHFWALSIPAMAQAKAVPGCYLADARTEDGTYFTLSVWDDCETARRFSTTGAHARALAAFPFLGESRIVQWSSDQMPSWNDAVARWVAEDT